MNKHELKALNAELIDLLIGVREQIDEKLDELAAVGDEDDEPEADDEPEGDDDELPCEDDED